MQAAKAHYPLSFGQGELVSSRTKGLLPVLELSQNPSRKHVLGDISFGFHYKATSMSLEASVGARGRWCPTVQSLDLSWHKDVHHWGREDAEIT